MTLAFDWRVQKLISTPSTNDDAKLAAQAGEAEGLVIQALRQTSGRGRHGRVWESPEGNLYSSILLRPTLAAKDIGQLSFVAALAIHDTVRAFLPKADITLKWPNDVLVDGKKISGILLESGEGWLVMGIGLNVRHHPEGGLYPSTSLTASGAGDLALDEVLVKLLEHVGQWYETLQKKGFEPVRAAWLSHAKTGAMTVKLPNGTIEGDFVGLDANGCLRLRLADGTERAIATGDVFPTLGQ